MISFSLKTKIISVPLRTQVEEVQVLGRKTLIWKLRLLAIYQLTKTITKSLSIDKNYYKELETDTETDRAFIFVCM